MTHRRAHEMTSRCWLDELIMCGWPWPVARRQALTEMESNGFDRNEAIKALCWYKSVDYGPESF